LRRLQAGYPQLAITAEVCGPARIWVARGGTVTIPGWCCRAT
jgi:hypothetical protein